MEELLAYAYLIAEGFDKDFGMGIAENFEKRLDELFIADPENSNLLELEMLGGNIREMVIYVLDHIDHGMDRDRFGKMLMELLKPVYRSMDIGRFGIRMFSLWEWMGWIQDEEPFKSLAYADYDDILLRGDDDRFRDEVRAREVYERMLSFYDDDCY
ncbi:MAG: hypothetical protein K2K57_04575 [Oscillospiraceae bacterium]|nr:hypothetical protein [Oscillospiraceae bacterium]